MIDERELLVEQERQTPEVESGVTPDLWGLKKAVDLFFEKADDEPHSYEAGAQAMLSRSLSAETRKWTGVGSQALSGIFSNVGQPRVFGVSDDFVQTFKEKSEVFLQVREPDAPQPWYVLARRYSSFSPQLVSGVGTRDMVVEATQMGETERTMHGLWALQKPFEPTEGSEWEKEPYATWFSRLVFTLVHSPMSWDLKTAFVSSSVPSEVEQPYPRLSLSADVTAGLRDASTYRRKGGGEKVEGYVPIKDISERLGLLYENLRANALEMGNQTGNFEMLVKKFVDHSRKRFTQEVQAEPLLASVQSQAIEKLVGGIQQELGLNAFSFAAQDAARLHNNGLLVSHAVLDNLLYAYHGQYEVVAHGIENNRSQYGIFWIGQNMLATVIPSVLGGFDWLHIDKISDTQVDTADIPELRSIIGEVLTKGTTTI